MMFFLEITEPNGSFHEGTVIGGIVVLCVSVVLPFFRDWMKDRRERLEIEARDKRDRENDAVTQQYLKSIADTNKQLADNQASSNILLATHIAKSDTRHEENIRTMGMVCRIKSKSE